MTGFLKPIETNFDGLFWIAFAEFKGHKYIAEGQTEQESKDSICTLIATRIVFGEQRDNKDLPVL